LGEHIRWARNNTMGDPPQGIKFGKDLQVVYPGELGEGLGRNDFNTAAVTYYNLQTDGTNLKFEHLSDEDVEKKSELWLGKAQIVVADGDAGKTNLAEAKAQKYCRLLPKKYYCYAEGQACFETYLQLAKIPNLLPNAGALVFADFQRISDKCKMNDEEAKTIFSTKRLGSVTVARNSVLTLPQDIPRLFSFNQSFADVMGIELPTQTSALEETSDSEGEPKAKKCKIDPSGSAASSSKHTDLDDLLAYLQSSDKRARDLRPIFYNSVIAGIVQPLETKDIMTEEAREKFKKEQGEADVVYKRNHQIAAMHQSSEGHRQALCA